MNIQRRQKRRHKGLISVTPQKLNQCLQQYKKNILENDYSTTNGADIFEHILRLPHHSHKKLLNFQSNK